MFYWDNGIVKPNPETLGVYPFSVMWNRDTSHGKDIAHLEFKFVECFCSPRKTNEFFGYDRNTNRGEKILENIRKTHPDFTPDDLIREGVEQYDEFWHNASPQLSYYESTLIAAKQIESFFRRLDMTEVNVRTGAPIYKPKEITAALADTKTVLASLSAIREQVYQEIYDSTKSKGNREINYFEE